MTEQKTGQPNGKMRRSLRVLLIGSLALNLLIVGLVAGAAFSIRGNGPPTPITDRFGSPHIKALSQDDKREMGRAIRSAYRKADLDRTTDRALYTQVLAQLRATPFDVDALQSVVMQQDASHELRRALARDVFLSQIASMSDAERAAYADRLQEVLERVKDKKHPKDGDKRPPKGH